MTNSPTCQDELILPNTLAQATQKSRAAVFHGSGAIAPKRPLEVYPHTGVNDLHTGLWQEGVVVSSGGQNV